MRSPTTEQVDELAGVATVTPFLLLRAFASGGAAVTGVEAISNGVPAFKEPAWKNARTTLVIMGSILGVMFLGISWLAAQVQAVPDPGQDRHRPDRRGRLRHQRLRPRSCSASP